MNRLPENPSGGFSVRREVRERNNNTIHINNIQIKMNKTAGLRRKRRRMEK
jgi:hypothetical protein